MDFIVFGERGIASEQLELVSFVSNKSAFKVNLRFLPPALRLDVDVFFF